MKDICIPIDFPYSVLAEVEGQRRAKVIYKSVTGNEGPGRR